MTKEELRQAIDLLKKKRNEDLKAKFQQLLNIVQKTTTFELYLTNFYSESRAEFNFKKEGDNFGLEFAVSYSDYRGVDLSHSMGLSANRDYLVEVRPFIKERDRIIGKLWDYEEDIIKFFKDVEQFIKTANDTICDLEFDLRNLIAIEKQEAFNNAMAQVKQGRKFHFKWRVEQGYHIEKITEKLVYTNAFGYERNRKGEFASMINNGTIIWEEDQ